MIAELPLLVQLTDYATRKEISLPVFNPVASQLQDAANSDAYDIAAIEQAIDSDTALAAEVLRAANSAFFGGLVEVATIRAAILRLGLRQVTNLVVLATEKSRYTARQPQIHELMKVLWQHASACALASEWLAKRLRYTQHTEVAFIGGLLHDIGKLFLLRTLDEMMSEMPRPAGYPISLVHDLLDQAHTSQGHRLLLTWNLPVVYQTIVRDHHSQTIDPANVPLLLVRLANHACNKVGLGLRSDSSLSLPATAEAAALGVSEVALAEIEIILEGLRETAAA